MKLLIYSSTYLLLHNVEERFRVASIKSVNLKERTEEHQVCR
jgi:hypothetical protein